MSRRLPLALACLAAVGALLATRQAAVGQAMPVTVTRVSPGVELNLEPLTTNAARPIAAPDQVRTDATGAALLAGGGCQVRVQPATSLVLGACPRGGVADAGTACLEGGAAVLNACPGLVLQTPGADVRMDSGWAAVRFDPASARTTVLVLKGRSNVAELYDLAGNGASAFVPVDAGHFLTTAPGLGPETVSGVAERTSLPAGDLTAAAAGLGLQAWLGQSLVQAAVDGVSLAPQAPALPAGTCTVPGSGLRLRYGPGTSYGILRTLPTGTNVRPIGQGAGGTWLSVQVLPSGQLGWVSAPLVTCSGVNVAALPPGQVLAQPATPVPPTPSGPPPATPLPYNPTLSPVIEFTVDRGTIKQGQCTKIRWHTSGIREVYFDGEGVTGDGERKVCPDKSRKYHLDVTLTDGSRTRREVEVRVK
jgi:hypothetical protein